MTIKALDTAMITRPARMRKCWGGGLRSLRSTSRRGDRRGRVQQPRVAFRRGDPEGLGQLLDHRDGGIAGAALDVRIGTKVYGTKAQAKAHTLHYSECFCPAFFDRWTIPKIPQELLTYPCVRVRLPNGALFRWRFEKGAMNCRLMSRARSPSTKRR